MSASYHRDPVFDEVARREEEAQWQAAKEAARVARLADRRKEFYYRVHRRRRVRLLVQRVMR